MKLDEVFNLIALKMAIEFERSGHVQSDLKKVAREATVRRFLQDFLPKSLGVGQGQVISTEGDVPGEVDIVIYDANRTPLLPIAEGVQIFPVEGVYALVEVEAHLDSRTLRRHIDKIQVAKSLPKRAYFEQPLPIIYELYGKQLEHFPTLAAVFAFDSINLKQLRELLTEECKKKKLSIEQQIDLVVVLNKGLLVHVNPENKIQFPPVPGCRIEATEGNIGQNLSLFSILLMDALYQATVGPIKLLRNYVIGPGVTYGRFVSGKDDAQNISRS